MKLHAIIDFLRARGMIDPAFRNPPNARIRGVTPISATQPETLSWMRAQQLDWPTIQAAAVICAREFVPPADVPIAFIPVTNPRLAFIRVLREFFPPLRAREIHPTAQISDTAIIGSGVSIGAYTVVGDNVWINDDTEIGHHCVIANTGIGMHCVIKSHAVIGEDGFGFENDEEGHPIHMPHLGGVVIGNHVSIGSFTTIVRATLGETRIGDHVKIDDHVHIAHNVTIGDDTMITAFAEVSGGVAIGRNVWLAPNCSILQKLTIGDDAFVAIGAVVIKDVGPNQFVMGSPARVIKKRFEDR